MTTENSRFVKMLSLYVFPGFQELGGVWETYGVKGFDTKFPDWKLRRVITWSVTEKLGEEKEFPEIIIEKSARKFDRSALLGIETTTDTERLDWIIKNNADIDSPIIGEEKTWVIYTPDKQFGNGAGCHSDLRKAIDLAIENDK